MKYSKKRGIVAGLVFISVVVGLVAHTATGTPSALGWRDIAAICPVGALEVLAGAKAFLVHPAILLVAVIVAGIFVGKAFCAWVCPAPHIRSFFSPRKKKDSNAKPNAPSCSACGACPKASEPLAPIGGKRDGKRFDSRHVTLLAAIASSFAFGFPVFCLICPVGLTFAVVIGVWNLFQFNEASWGLIVFPALILLEVVFFKKWCTNFCPIGALFSLLSGKRATLRPVVDKSACLRQSGVDCTACVRACPEEVDPHSGTISECTKCGACVEACPAKAIALKFSKSDVAGKK